MLPRISKNALPLGLFSMCAIQWSQGTFSSFCSSPSSRRRSSSVLRLLDLALSCNCCLIPPPPPQFNPPFHPLAPLPVI